MKNQQQRTLQHIISGTPTSDGDGVQLTRVIGSAQLNMLDPFLLLDVFGSDKPLDYIGGFPSHPHRGFETVTYMLAGNMRHQDSVGNVGVISAGGVQWMTTGKGIIHSEMPEQDHGLLSGLQLWVNLPAEHKMTQPQYQEFAATMIPVESLDGIGIKVIAGTTQAGTQGVINNQHVHPIFWHIQHTADKVFEQVIPSEHNAFIYVLNGEITVADKQDKLDKGQLGVLSLGDKIMIRTQVDSDYVLIAAQPLNQPVARGGPFVMNTRAEIIQAFVDYQAGRLA